ncbi:MAG: 30S ribosomal protein S5 [Myxococcota bacterium]|nr:30S ribosomal protein S5 [Myxococcota bacterium]
MSRGRRNQPDDGLTEKVININRVAKVVKGGRRFSFSAIVVVGDGEGKVGVGFGKANEVPEAIRKASTKARANMFQAAMVDGTVPHKQVGNFGAGQVLLLPAAPGTGVIAGPSIRAILDAAGYHNVLTKCLGTNNSHNVVRATLNALHLLETPEQYAVRVGKDVSEVTPNYVVGEAHWASIQ